ncbi:MAG: gluconokinase [Chitinophagaceae bacterium]
MTFTIGLDIGTTSTKAVIADGAGRAVWSEKKSYPFSQPRDGYHEQDPAEILAAVNKLLTLAFLQVVKKDLSCITLSSAMHSLIVVDQSGTALSPMMTWADTRSRLIAESLKGTEQGQRIYLATGTPVHPMSPLCKITWLRESQPELYAAAFKFISIKEYVWFHLTGEFLIDYSIASATGLFNIRELTWNPESLFFAGITGDKLSTPVPVSHLTSRDGIDYIIGASDGALANIGTGAIHAGEVALTIGTSGAVRILNKKPLADYRGRLFNYVVDDGFFLCGGAINNGGITLRWFIDSFYGEGITDFNTVLAEAEGIKAGSEGLIFLPYIYGERAPIWDAGAQGVFFGIRSVHNRAHFLRAVLEGISFSLKQVLEALEENGETIDTVFASGGFISSPIWLGILGDILRKKIRLTQDADASAMGAIFLGMKVKGLTESWEQAAGNLETSQVLDPVNGPDVYKPNYEVYCRLYDKLKDEFHRG